MKKILIALLACIVGNATMAQIQQNTGWLASFNSIKLNSKFSVHAELQIRSSDEWKRIQTILPRFGLNYHFAKNQILTLGYAPIYNRAVLGEYSALLLENRLFQQYIFNHPVGRVLFQHRFRLEERWVAVGGLKDDEFQKVDELYSTRLRYFLRSVIPFTAQKPLQKGPYVALQEEIFLNISHQNNVNGQTFDQNRAYAGFGYRLSKKMDLELGYLHQFVARRRLVGSNANTDISNHVLQLAVFTRL